jgi:hypothetical protein
MNHLVMTSWECILIFILLGNTSGEHRMAAQSSSLMLIRRYVSVFIQEHCYGFMAPLRQVEAGRPLPPAFQVGCMLPDFLR